MPLQFDQSVAAPVERLGIIRLQSQRQVVARESLAEPLQLDVEVRAAVEGNDVTRVILYRPVKGSDRFFIAVQPLKSSTTVVVNSGIIGRKRQCTVEGGKRFDMAAQFHQRVSAPEMGRRILSNCEGSVIARKRLFKAAEFDQCSTAIAQRIDVIGL